MSYSETVGFGAVELPGFLKPASGEAFYFLHREPASCYWQGGDLDSPRYYTEDSAAGAGLHPVYARHSLYAVMGSTSGLCVLDVKGTLRRDLGRAGVGCGAIVSLERGGTGKGTVWTVYQAGMAPQDEYDTALEQWAATYE